MIEQWKDNPEGSRTRNERHMDLVLTPYRLVVSRPRTFSQDEKVRRQLLMCYQDEGIVSALSN